MPSAVYCALASTNDFSPPLTNQPPAVTKPADGSTTIVYVAAVRVAWPASSSRSTTLTVYRPAVAYVCDAVAA